MSSAEHGSTYLSKQSVQAALLSAVEFWSYRNPFFEFCWTRVEPIINIKTLIISKKPVNTGKSRDRDTEFTTKLLLLEKASTRLLLPVKCLPPGRHIRLKLNMTPQKRRSLIPLWEKRTPLFLRPNSERRRRHVFHIRRRTCERRAFEHLECDLSVIVKPSHVL